MAPPKRRIELNEVMINVGNTGRYQVLVFLLLFITGIFHGARITFCYFFHFQPDYRCAIPGWDNDTYAKGDYAHQVAVNETIPAGDICYVYNASVEFKYDKYHRPINANATGDVQHCIGSKWVYDKSVMIETPTSEYDLVCDQDAFVSYVVMAIMFGSLIGSLFFGWIADRLGRRLCFQLTLLLSLVTGIALTFAPTFLAFAILSSLAAAGTTGMFSAALVTAIELALPEYRKFPVLIMQIFYPLGEIFLSATSFGFRNWKWMNLTITAPSVLMCSYYWLVPESPRWLMVNKRYVQLEKVLQTIARGNQRHLPSTEDGREESLAAMLESQKVEGEIPPPLVRDSMLGMFTSWRLCLRSLAAFWNWYVVYYVFYGLILNSSNLGQGPLLNFLLAALVEIPAHLMSLFLVDRVGRKPVHLTYLTLVIISSAAAIGVSYCVNGYHWLILVFALIGKFGGAGLMGTSFLWMSELFPTSVRGTAIGMMGVCSRLGAITVPYIVQKGSEALPFITFCALASSAFLAVLKLPETSGRQLPATIADAKTFDPDQQPTPPEIQDSPLITERGASQYGAVQSKDK